jgi:hypothetical protein
MNFLSHYFFDNIPGNHYYNFGLILPDLLGIYNRKWKFSTKVIPKNDHHFSQINSGALRHLQTDHEFHNSDWFQIKRQEVKALLYKHNLNFSPFRPFFISHILVELILDRVILKKDIETAHHFYTDMDLINDEVIVSLLNKSNFAPAGEFISFFNRFRQHRYVFTYADNEKFIFSLNRIFSRVNNPIFEGEFKEILIHLIFETEQLINNDLYEAPTN